MGLGEEVRVVVREPSEVERRERERKKQREALIKASAKAAVNQAVNSVFEHAEAENYLSDILDQVVLMTARKLDEETVEKVARNIVDERKSREGLSPQDDDDDDFTPGTGITVVRSYITEFSSSKEKIFALLIRLLAEDLSSEWLDYDYDPKTQAAFWEALGVEVVPSGQPQR